MFFPEGTYWLGPFSTADAIINLSGLGDGISILTQGKVEFLCETTASVFPSVFFLENNSNFYSQPVCFRDLGYDPTITWKGAVGFFLRNPLGGNWGSINIEAIYSKNMVGSVFVVSQYSEASNRIRGINIGQIFSDSCYYAFNSQEQGDGVNIDLIYAYDNWRPYYVHGCSGHAVNIFNRKPRGTGSGAVNIARVDGGLDTTSIHVNYTARDVDQTSTHIFINHIDLLGGTIAGITANVDIRGSTLYFPARFVNYTGSGGTETSAPSLNIVRDITLSGSCDVNAANIEAVASYASKGILNMTYGNNFSLDQTVIDIFNLDKATINGVPGWVSSSGTNPAIGNGSLTYDLYLNSGLAYLNVNLVIGSTTTLGVGDWFFNAFGVGTKNDSIGSGLIYDNSTGTYYPIVCKFDTANARIGMYIQGTTPIGPAVPFAWATGDKLDISIVFPIS